MNFVGSFPATPLTSECRFGITQAKVSLRVVLARMLEIFVREFFHGRDGAPR